jgi:hypothetical protein
MRPERGTVRLREVGNSRNPKVKIVNSARSGASCLPDYLNGNDRHDHVRGHAAFRAHLRTEVVHGVRHGA